MYAYSLQLLQINLYMEKKKNKSYLGSDQNDQNMLMNNNYGGQANYPGMGNKENNT